MRAHQTLESIHSKKNTCTTCSSTLWRNAAYYTSVVNPYPGIPHLRGNWRTGMLTSLQQGLTQTALQAAQKGGVCTFWSDDRVMILLSDPELVYQYKVHCLHKYTDPRIENWDTLLGPSATNQQHRTTRKIWHDFINQNSSHIEQTALNHASSEIRKLNESRSFEIEDAQTYFRSIALTLSMKIFMNMHSIDLDLKQANVKHFLDAIYGEHDKDVGLYLLNLKQVPTDPAMKQKIETYNQKMASEFKTLVLDPALRDPESMLAKLWKATEDLHAPSATEANFFAETFFFITGGPIMTVGDGFTSILQSICQNALVKYKFVSLLLSNEDEADQYLDQIIKETFRLVPLVGVLPARLITKSFTLNEFSFKEGDYIFVSPYVNHYDPNVWQNPTAFDPDRFSKDNEGMIPPGAYLPFGLGERECPGRKYGLTVVKTILKEYFKHFDITLAKDAQLTHKGPIVEGAHTLAFHLNARENNRSLTL